MQVQWGAIIGLWAAWEGAFELSAIIKRRPWQGRFL
jgi:hypothetical protein